MVSQLVLTIPGKAMSTKGAAFPELVSELRSSLDGRLVVLAKCALDGYTASIQACTQIVDSGDVAIQAKLESTEVLKGPAVEELRAVWRSGRAKEPLSAQGVLESFYTMVELASLKLTVDGDDHTHDFQNALAPALEEHREHALPISTAVGLLALAQALHKALKPGQRRAQIVESVLAGIYEDGVTLSERVRTHVQKVLCAS